MNPSVWAAEIENEGHKWVIFTTALLVIRLCCLIALFLFWIDRENYKQKSVSIVLIHYPNR